MSLQLKISDKKYNLLNGFVYVHPENFSKLCHVAGVTTRVITGNLRVFIGKYIFNLFSNENILMDEIYFNRAGRITVYLPMNEIVDVVISDR